MKPRRFCVPHLLRWLVVLTVALGVGLWGQSADELATAAEKGDIAALQQLRALADKGDAHAQFSLGYMYANGMGVPKDAAQAVAWYRKAADQGDPIAQFNLGVLGVAQAQPTSAVQAPQQQTLYELYLSAKDGNLAALQQLKENAQQGVAAAQAALGYMYARGEGVQTDAVQAVVWFRKAAEQGHAFAEFNLGWMYREGNGVPKDFMQAVTWYRKAAEQGYAQAQANLGRMYASGEGVAKDTVQAAIWYRKAAEQGLADGQMGLGFAYAQGEGVPKDLVTAYMWVNLATAQGYEIGKEVRDIWEKQMTPQQIAEAQRLSREWKLQPQPQPQK
jgi:TPR repeat protein